MQSRFTRIQLVVLGMTIIIGSGCDAEFVDSQVDVTQFVEQSSTVLSPSPTVTVTLPTPSATVTEMPITGNPTPRPLPEDFDFRTFLFADNPCQLPCWQGLVVGKATLDDVLHTSDQTLSRRMGVAEPWRPEHLGVLAGSNWLFPDEGGFFTFEAFFDSDHTLTGLLFHTSNMTAYPTISLALILDKLGIPDFWTLNWNRGGFYQRNSSFRELDYMPWELIYKEGIYIKMRVFGPVTPLNSDYLEYFLTVCKQSTTNDFTHILLAAPYEDIHPDLLDQISWIDDDPARFNDDQIVEDTFGMSKDAVMAHFMASEDACLTTR